MNMEKYKSEADIQKAILDYLEEKMINNEDLWVSRLHSGTAMRRKSLIRLASAGSPDIICVYKGIFYGLEVKRHDGVQSGIQEWTESLFGKAGAEYHIVKSLKEVIKILKI